MAMLEVNNLSIQFGGLRAVDGFNMTIEKGQLYGLIGPNGAGKSTLLKMIVGESAPDDGNVILTKGKTLGYLAQHQEMQSGNTIYEEVRTAKADIIAMERRIREIEMELKHLSGDALNDRLETYNRLTAAFERENGYSCESEITGVLKGLGFTENDFTKPVDTLSGGQKTRVSLGKLLLTKPDILLLDEPTNHLDMRSKDVLKDALKEFDGTVIVVSHDREILDRLVEKVYEFGNKRVIEHLGGIYDFLEHKKMDSLRELERSTQVTVSMEGTVSEPTRNKLSYEARKEQSKAIKKVEKAIAESEKKITELESSIAAIEAKLATPKGAADVSLYTEYSDLKKNLSDTMDLWTEQTLELEELNAANS